MCSVEAPSCTAVAAARFAVGMLFWVVVKTLPISTRHFFSTCSSAAQKRSYNNNFPTSTPHLVNARCLRRQFWLLRYSGCADAYSCLGWNLVTLPLAPPKPSVVNLPRHQNFLSSEGNIALDSGISTPCSPSGNPH